MTTTKHHRIFDGFDEGAYTLPGELLDLRAAVVHAKEVPVPEDPLPGALERLNGSIEAALLAGAPLPKVDDVAKARAQSLALADLRAGLRYATEQLVRRLDDAVVDLSEQIIAEHLRPAFDDVMADVAELAPSLAGFDLEHASESVLLLASTEVREAVHRLVLAAERYTALRRARSALVIANGGPEEATPADHHQRFAEIKNLYDVWPGVGQWVSPDAPWPTSPRARLLWLHTSAAEPWMPTFAEQDARGAAIFAKDGLTKPGRAGSTRPPVRVA